MDKKEEYIRKLEAQLREWSSKIDELQIKADRMKADARVKYKESFETWDKRKEQAQIKLKELKEGSGPAWEEFKTGIENAWQELKTAFDNAIAKLKQH